MTNFGSDLPKEEVRVIFSNQSPGSRPFFLAEPTSGGGYFHLVVQRWLNNSYFCAVSSQTVFPQMNEENPINPISVAENPGLLPYAHTAGGAIIRPEDEGKIKGKSVKAMRQQTDRQMGQLKGQMQTLVEQAREIQRRIEVSERIYTATMNFEPHIGQTLYMYERHNGSDLLSLVAPHEWGRSFRYHRFVARVTMLYDHTWDVDFNEE